MSSRILLMVLCLLALSGCDKVNALMGKPVAEPKDLDAQAIGYACRVSKKPPEPCMKENEAHRPALILNGWKNADKELKLRVIEIGPNGELLANPVSAVVAARPAPVAPPVKKEEN
jgi:hypothetical protein